MKKLSVMLALMLVCGLALSGCKSPAGESGNGGGERGIITITDIPLEYNGCYAGFVAYDDDSTNSRRIVVGVQEANYATQIITLGRISSGKVSLPMWYPDNSSQTIKRYYGNDTFITPQNNYYGGVALHIHRQAIATSIDNSGGYYVLFHSVTFSNGSAALSVNDALYNRL